MAKIYNDITETIGNTPLVRLNRTAAAHGAQADVLLKLEFFGVKRPAPPMRQPPSTFTFWPNMRMERHPPEAASGPAVRAACAVATTSKIAPTTALSDVSIEVRTSGGPASQR